MGLRDEWDKAKAANNLGNGGIAQQTKANTLGQDAASAYRAGDWYFTPVLNMPATKSGGFSGNIRDWALMLQAITQAGWQLHTWAVNMDREGRPEATPLFVRQQQ
ncbi:hypothetical protein [Actinoplanes palleronii]|uniref:Uncharacterized protein n=1 Tax=Actinoplanes palleronii TaxID=113570 RepID=A0ABQ4B3Z9_9ACTN|nr:hypothetical protein [Actinoplanes palleronii]GIE65392.1 hypothetical protein Apa02nite_015000 [Actinoplanes palleronii]